MAETSVSMRDSHTITDRCSRITVRWIASFRFTLWDILRLLSANGLLIVFSLFSLFAPSGQMLSDSVHRSKQQQVKSDREDVNKDDGRD